MKKGRNREAALRSEWRGAMRKNSILILLVLFCAILFATPAPALMTNEPEDFRGILWFASHKGNLGFNKWGLEKKEKNSVLTTFQRKNEKLQIGAAQLKSIEYKFLDNVGLVQVVVRVENAVNVDALLNACTENWGEPRDRSSHNNFLVWVGKKVEARIYVFANSSRADLFIEVKKMQKLVEEQQKILTKDSKKDF